MSATAQTGAPSVATAPPRRRSRASQAGSLLSGGLLLVALLLLVAVVVAGANGLRVRVEQTGSMAPAIQPGDLVVVQQTPITSIRPGDVIGVRNSSGAVIVHRVERIDGAGAALRVTTQGDANPTSENWTLNRTAEVALVRGTFPDAGSIVDALKGPLIAIIVLIAALILAVSQLRSIWSRS